MVITQKTCDTSIIFTMDKDLALYPSQLVSTNITYQANEILSPLISFRLTQHQKVRLTLQQMLPSGNLVISLKSLNQAQISPNYGKKNPNDPIQTAFNPDMNDSNTNRAVYELYRVCALSYIYLCSFLFCFSIKVNAGTAELYCSLC